MITALIPARSGSKRIPNKNITLLGGHPLLTWSIAAAKMCPEIDETWVSTDDLTYAEIAEKYGAEAIMRPLASDMDGDETYLSHFLLYIKTDMIVLLRPTTPLRQRYYIESAIAHFSSFPCSSLRSSHPVRESPLKMYYLNPELRGYYNSTGDENIPNQLLPQAYQPNGYVDILRGPSYGKDIATFITPEVPELDRPEDLEYAEWYLSQHGSVLLEYLNQITKV